MPTTYEKKRNTRTHLFRTAFQPWTVHKGMASSSMRLCGPGTYSRLKNLPEIEGRSLVLVEADLWADFIGTFHQGRSQIVGHKIVERNRHTGRERVASVQASIEQQRNNVLWHIARCPHLTFVLYTDHPERVVITEQAGKLPPNVWLLARVRTQREASELFHLAVTLATMPVERVGVLVVPRELLTLKLQQRKSLLKQDAGRPLLDWILVHGDDQPCHIEAVMGCLAQARGEGIPAYVSQLGSCVTSACNRTPSRRKVTLDQMSKLGGYPVKYKARLGNCPEEWPPELRVFEFPGEQKTKPKSKSWGE